MKLGILDYGAGNIRSVINAFAGIGRHPVLIRDESAFAEIDLLIFPGQGAFGDCVKYLHQNGLWNPLKDWLAARRPYIGICLGYQLLFESSEESPGVEGLAVAEGVVRRFDAESGLKIPHMGWNQVQWTGIADGWSEGIPEGAHFYFVHSFYPQPVNQEEVLCVAQYDGPFAAGIARDYMLAVQFHPEKSQQFGLKLLANAVHTLEQRQPLVGAS